MKLWRGLSTFVASFWVLGMALSQDTTPSVPPASMDNGADSFPALLARTRTKGAPVRPPSVAELEKRLLNAETAQDSLLISIGLARAWLLKGEAFRAISTIDQAWSSCEQASRTLQVMCGLVAGEASLALGRGNTAVRYLREVFIPADANFRRMVLGVYFRALVASDARREAWDVWQRWREELRKVLDLETLDESLRNLAHAFQKNREQERAFSLLADVASNFPRTAASVAAYRYFGSKECRGCRQVYIWPNEEAREKHARKMLLELPRDPEVRSEAFGLMGITETEVPPKTPVGRNSLEENARLLETAEFLLSVRQYEMAYSLLKYLRGASAFGGTFQLSTVSVLLGRAALQLERYSEAAVAYQEAYQKAPAGRFTRRAYEGYLLSLHYLGRYRDEAKALRTFLSQRVVQMPPAVQDWNLFWLAYLAGDLSVARDMGEDSLRKAGKGSMNEARLKYWLARVLEKEGKTQAARKSLLEVAENFPRSHYAVLARWRLEGRGADARQDLVPVPEVRQRSALSYEGLASSTDEDINLAAKLAELGLFDFVGFVLARLDTRELPPEQVPTLLDVATRSGAVRWAVLRALAKIEFSTETGPNEKALVETIRANQDVWEYAWPFAWDQVVDEVARLYELPPEILLGIMRAESMYRPDAVSYVDAQGLMQMMPRTAHRVAALGGDEDFEVSSLRRPEVNIPYGGWYIKRLMDYYGGNVILSLAGYNAGPHLVDAWIRQNPGLEIDEFMENIPYDQTRAYVMKILRYMDTYRRVWSLGEQGLQLNLQSRLPTVHPNMEMF